MSSFEKEFWKDTNVLAERKKKMIGRETIILFWERIKRRD